MNCKQIERFRAVMKREMAAGLAPAAALDVALAEIPTADRDRRATARRLRAALGALPVEPGQADGPLRRHLAAISDLLDVGG